MIMKNYIILFFVSFMLLGLSMTLSPNTNAAPTNLNNSGTLIIVCDIEGLVREGQSEDMSSTAPEEVVEGGNCDEGDDCGECAEEVGEANCMLQSLQGPSTSDDTAFTINLLCPGLS